MAEPTSPTSSTPSPTLTSEDIYTHLKLIKDIAFTHRELDVIACILGGRKPKKIAILLSIATKTVENHIHNIKQKLGCSSQDSIIDFVEKAGVAPLLKHHYSINFAKDEGEFQNNEFQNTALSQAWLSHTDCPIPGLTNTNVPNKTSTLGNFYNLPKQKLIVGILGLTLTITSFTVGSFYLYQKLCSPKPNAQTNLSLNQNIQLVPGKTVRWNLPRQDLQFIGRESLLKTLQAQLNRKDIASQDPMHISICAGLGGIGKTQLALQYAHATKTPHNLIAWFPSENIAHLQQKYTEFARALGYSEPDAPIKDIIAYVHKWLSENPGWLLIYDNVGSYEEIKSFLPTQGGHIIATSRQRVWPNIFKMLDIDVMTEQEAILLLKSQIKSNGNLPVHADNAELDNNAANSEEKLKKIAKLLGYLPLAIAQAGAIIQQSQISPAEYLHLYQMHEQKMLSAKLLPSETNSSSVAITWNMTLKALAKEAQDQNEPPYALNLLKACAYLAPEKISRELLLTWFKEAYPNMSTPELALTQALGQLWKYSFINIDDQENITVHRLVQSVVRQQPLQIANVKVNDKKNNFREKRFEKGLEKEKEKTASDESQYFQVILSALDKTFHQKTGNTEADELREQALLPHLQSVSAHFAEAEKLLSFPDQNLQRHPNFQHDITLQKNTLHKISLPNLQLAYSNVLENLGVVYSRLAISKQARDYLEQSLKLKEKYIGKNHQESTRCLTALGMVYRTLGEAALAKDLLEQALTLQEKNHGNSDIALAPILSELGMSYKDLGELKKGKTLMERALKIQENHYGKDHLNVAKTLIYISNAYGYMGDPQSQKSSAERSLKIFEKHVKSDHPYIANALSNIAYSFQAFGNPSKAKEYLERALNIRLKHYGANHQRVARIHSYLAGIYRELKNPKRAIELANDALKVKEAYYRKNHPEIAKALLHLGGAEDDLGHYGEAKTFLVRALKINEGHYGNDHTEVAKVLYELASVHVHLKELADAESLAKRAHAIFVKNFGADNKYTEITVKLLQTLSEKTSPVKTSTHITAHNTDHNTSHASLKKQIHKKVLLISCGLAGTGKSTHLNLLKTRISNAVHIDKDTISDALMPEGVDLSSPAYKAIKDKVYDTMLKLADLNLAENRLVILEGYFGNKLTSPLLKNYLNSPNFETKIIYFYCSAAKQKARLEARAALDPIAKLRDKDKLDPGKFDAYRRDHINQHNRELAQVPHLVVDTENDADLEHNIHKIVDYIEIKR